MGKSWLKPSSMSLRPLVHNATTDVVEIVRELELEVEHEDVTEFMQLYHKKFMDGKLCFMNEQSVSLSGIYSWWKWREIVEVTISDLEYYNKGFRI